MRSSSRSLSNSPSCTTSNGRQVSHPAAAGIASTAHGCVVACCTSMVSLRCISVALFYSDCSATVRPFRFLPYSTTVQRRHSKQPSSRPITEKHPWRCSRRIPCRLTTCIPPAASRDSVERFVLDSYADARSPCTSWWSNCRPATRRVSMDETHRYHITLLGPAASQSLWRRRTKRTTHASCEIGCDFASSAISPSPCVSAAGQHTVWLMSAGDKVCIHITIVLRLRHLRKRQKGSPDRGLAGSKRI